uniref:GATA-type domain-containing protein n=1 Tax=Vannella robusta TaxID=1487602 RepID=A0A7S4MQC4_9EUKA|mmetsp:Transcript_6639/g.8215  ORF Transcript_6639/g.8215 Transcript_6639/m.8215 type:complete len:101 (+) Transcript_6639:68-370(+)
MTQYVFIDEKPSPNKLKIHFYQAPQQRTSTQESTKQISCSRCFTKIPHNTKTRDKDRILCNTCGSHYQKMLQLEKKIPVVDNPKPIPIHSLLNRNEPSGL